MGFKKNMCLILFLFSINLISGCTSNEVLNQDSTVKDLSNDIESTEVFAEQLTSLDVNYLSNDSFKFKTNLEEDYNEEIVFQNRYTVLEGIPTFRGNHHRNSPSFGISDISTKSLSTLWEFRTSSSSWGGGAGWTGQPAIIRWPKELREKMNIKDEFKYKDNLTEAIYASLDGNIYFIDIETGVETRDKIHIGNPIKGSVSIDPRGLPLLYVGEGIKEKGSVGFNIYSLIDGSHLFELNGNDSFASRNWPAFDSCAIVNAESDSVIVGGENGLLYIIKLNSNYNEEKNIVSINPKTSKYSYSVPNSKGRLGIENSVATYANLAYFADNNGIIQCVDLNTLKPVWFVDGYDDIDATLTLDIVDKVPYVYCGNEVDHQGSKGIVKLKKINGLDGSIVWEKEFACESLVGKKAVNGGLMATNIVGKNKLDDLVIFSLARYDGFNKGGIIALDKKSGDLVWETKIDNYMWSSPVDIYDKGGNGYIIQGDSVGNLHLLDGKSGNILNTITLNGNIESSPAIFENTLVVATRNGTIYGVDIN